MSHSKPADKSPNWEISLLFPVIPSLSPSHQQTTPTSTPRFLTRYRKSSGAEQN